MAILLAVAQPAAAMDDLFYGENDILFYDASSPGACDPSAATGPTSRPAGSPNGLTYPASLDKGAIERAIEAWIKKTRPNSPFIGTAKLAVASANQANVSPFLVFAQALHEEGLGTVDNEIVKVAHNSFGRTATTTQPYISGGGRLWYKWTSFAASVDYAAAENVGRPGGDQFSYIRAVYGAELDQGIDAYINKYAPSSDGNNHDAYIKAIQGPIDEMAEAAGGSITTASSGSGSADSSCSAPTGAAVGDGDVRWPVDKANWDDHKQVFLNAHNGGGTFTAPGTPQVADDVALPKGTQVYAMVGGKVIKRPLGRSGHQCHGHPDGGDNGGLEIESAIQGGTLQIAYAHGYDVTSSATVRAGDPIMLLGDVGNACGAHLHIDMSFNGKNLCPQDVFVELGAGRTPDFAALTSKAEPMCGGRS